MPVHPRQLTAWRKSSHSLNEDEACVEVADFAGAAVGVRDSKSPGGPHLLFPAGAWAGFVRAQRHGVAGH